jgi:hypothetical protein
MREWGRSRMSNWQAEKAERNRKSFARLSRALPAIFPLAVLARALNRPFIPPTPRLAIESYWRAHPIRADRLARALAAKTGAPVGWTWRISHNRKTGLAATFRAPPAPYRERGYNLGPGFCCVCGQPVYRLGWFKDLWDAGPTRTRSGIVPALSRGISGMHRMARRRFCVVFRGDAVPKQADGCRGTPK